MNPSRIRILALAFLICMFEQFTSAEHSGEPVRGVRAKMRVGQDTVSSLVALLDSLAVNSENPYFRQHCAAIRRVIESKDSLSAFESSLLAGIYTAFVDTSVQWNTSRMYSSG
jgi:hypothetical protein